jgi:hypothetical protein
LSGGGRYGIGSRGANNANKFGGKNWVILGDYELIEGWKRPFSSTKIDFSEDFLWLNPFILYFSTPRSQVLNQGKLVTTLGFTPGQPDWVGQIR